MSNASGYATSITNTISANKVQDSDSSQKQEAVQIASSGTSSSTLATFANNKGKHPNALYDSEKKACGGFDSKAEANEKADKSSFPSESAEQVFEETCKDRESKELETDTKSKQFTVTLMGGTTMDVVVQANTRVSDLRAGVEKNFTVPTHCYLKLSQSGQVLLDDFPIVELDTAQPVFGIISRETSLEVLLQAASAYPGYHDMIRDAYTNTTDKSLVCFGPMPTILQVLEDMGGQVADLKNLRKGEDERTLEFSGSEGHLLLPSIDAVALLQASSAEKFKSVTIIVEINSDAYNRGLGVVLEAASLMDSSVDEHGLPNYIYNGYGVSKDKKQNVIKFHPGMRGGQLRIEGLGGWGNSNIGFTPEGWKDSECKFHILELSLGADGANEMCIKGTKPGQEWRRSWTRQLTDGRYFPAMYAWLDMGSTITPVHIGDISFRVQMQ